MVVTMKRLRFFAFILCLLLTGCISFGQTGIADCNVLTASPLRSLMQADTLTSDPVLWIADTFALDPAAITGSYGEAGSSFEWDLNGIHYSLDISADGMPEEALVLFQKAKPTVGQMVECLAPPERYRARYFFHPPGVNSLVLDMYYPSQGLDAGHIYQTTNLKRRQPPTITANTPIENIRLSRPEETFEEYTRSTSLSPDLAEMVIGESKPWPGSWEQIEIDLGPFLESN